MYYIFATRRHCSRCNFEYEAYETEDKIDAIVTVTQYEQEGYDVTLIEGQKRQLIPDAFREMQIV